MPIRSHHVCLMEAACSQAIGFAGRRLKLLSTGGREIEFEPRPERDIEIPVINFVSSATLHLP